MIGLGLLLGAVPPPIANGEATAAFEAVGALYALSQSADGVEVCSGTLVAAADVVTAAHCVEKIDAYAAGGFRVYFLVGETVERFSDFAEVDTALAHPDWDPARVRWDIAVVSLVQELDLPVVPLGTELMDEAWIGREVRLVGWGNVDLEENGSGTKRTAVTTVAAVGEDQFTTTAASGGGASCPGDSGGAVLAEDGSLVGVVSWGTLDADAGHPCGGTQGHARVDAAADWVEGQLAGSDPGADTAAESGGAGGGGEAPAPDTEPAGCACAAGSPMPPPALPVLLLAAGRRRRR